VTLSPVASQAVLGRRIAQAREEAGLTQAELAASVDLDRTAVAKLESGSRKVSATELISLATALDRPIDWFVFESPAAVLSRRRDASVGGQSASLDRTVERLGRDVEFLLSQGILSAPESPTLFPPPRDYDDAERLASDARELLAVGSGPLHDLQAACESVNLLAFSIDLGESGGDAAYVEIDGLGVALINGGIDPGRRRFNLAHELGHHLIGDAYAPEATIGRSGETERFLNAFAAHLLMPRETVTERWNKLASKDRRLALVAISALFRVSWSAACGQVRNLGLIEANEAEHLLNVPPKAGDFLELGERWAAELEPPSVPARYGARVVAAYRTGRLTAARAVELLWNTIRENELPDVEDIPVEGLRREFDTLW
jgi:Zn-dependent peptidase ImmA (M78 family)/DNA-binding XRE family transcriptional regulator